MLNPAKAVAPLQQPPDYVCGIHVERVEIIRLYYRLSLSSIRHFGLAGFPLDRTLGEGEGRTAIWWEGVAYPCSET